MPTWSPMNSIPGYFLRHSPSTCASNNNVSASLSAEHQPWDRLMQHKPCGFSRYASAHSACKQNVIWVDNCWETVKRERAQPTWTTPPHTSYIPPQDGMQPLCQPKMHDLYVGSWLEIQAAANLVSPAYVNPNHRSFQSESSNSRLKHIWEKRRNEDISNITYPDDWSGKWCQLAKLILKAGEAYKM